MYVVCFVGDFAICKDEQGNVINIPRNKLINYKTGDYINDPNIYKTNESINSDKKENEEYEIYDDVIIELGFISHKGKKNNKK